MDFKQKSKVGISGNFINQLMGNNSTLPEVGKGATELLHSDRRCFEVLEVSKDYKTAKLQYLEAKHDKTKEGGMGHQNWLFEPLDSFITVVWRYGKWQVKYNSVEFTKEFISKADAEGTRCIKLLNDEEFEAIYDGEALPQNVVEGITQSVTKYQPIKLLFGVKDYYYNWEL